MLILAAIKAAFSSEGNSKGLPFWFYILASLVTILHNTDTMKTILSVYSGKSGKCCCGCSGKHTYVKALQTFAGKYRGYKVNDNECNDRTIKVISNKVLKSADVVHADNHSYTDDGVRLRIVYYTE